MLFTLAHELTHDIRIRNPEQYKNLTNTLLQGFVDQEQSVMDLIDGKMALDEGLSLEDALEEVVADSMESMPTDGTVMERLAQIKQKDKGLWEKIVDFFKDFANDLKKMAEAYKGKSANSAEGRMVQEMETLRKELQEIYTQALAEDYSSNEKTAPEGGKKNSIRTIVGQNGENYGIGVYLDSNLLDGLSEAERKKMVELYVKEELSGNAFIAYDSGSNPVEVTIADPGYRYKTRSGKKKPVIDELIKKNNDKQIKQEAVVLADELIESSTYRESKQSKYSHGKLDNFGKNVWDYRTVYIQEPNLSVWEATLNIANDENGQKILYDISPIKKMERPVKSGTTVHRDNYMQSSSESQGKNQLREGKSNRELLAGALETVAQTDMERERLEEYRGKIADIDELERELTTANKEIRSMIKGDIPYSRERMLELRTQANAAANRIDIADRQLLRLEATAPMKAVLERQRKAEQKKTTKRVEACICQEKVDTRPSSSAYLAAGKTRVFILWEKVRKFLRRGGTIA